MNIDPTILWQWVKHSSHAGFTGNSAAKWARIHKAVEDACTTGEFHADDALFALLLEWFMVSDPWPIDEESRDIVHAWLDAEAEKRGMEDWVGAYHELLGRCRPNLFGSHARAHHTVH